METVFHPQGEAVLKALASGGFDAKEWFDLRSAAERLSSQDGFERLVCLETLGVQLFPHQERAVLRVLREMRGRAVLADEVGLGKTIEAGVILKEYLLRSLVHRVLILTPASLVTQWRDELREKLQIEVAVAQSPSDFERAPRVVASLDTAKRSPSCQVIQRIGWDMVIVDEAHRLKNSRTVNWKFVNGIQKKYLLLLTATPVQNDLRELYNLVTLLKPGQLKTFAQFKQAYMLDRRSPKNVRGLREALSEVMVRTSRRETAIPFPVRRVRSVAVRMGEREREFYQRVLSLLRRVYRAMPKDAKNLLPLILVMRESASHPAAAVATLEGMAGKGRWDGLTPGAVAELRGMVEGLVPAKLGRLLDELEGQGEPCIVFTEFRATQEAIAEAVEQAGFPAHLFHGQLGPGERDRVVDAFRRRGGVLISTEAGGEGRNLQFCRRLINYDLPWNPMRVEQRIGRVHRLGQEHPVDIVNLVAEETVDAHVLYLLEKKLDMFHKVIGEIDAIVTSLGHGFERRVGDAALASGTDGEFLARIDAMGREIEEACRAYQRVRRLNAQLLDGAADEAAF